MEDYHKMCLASTHCWTRCWNQSRQSWCSYLCPAEGSQPVSSSDRDWH